MNNEELYREVVKSEQEAAIPVRNENLVCKDCLYSYDDTTILRNTSTCGIYELKPNSVLLGKTCNMYVEHKT